MSTGNLVGQVPQVLRLQGNNLTVAQALGYHQKRWPNASNALWALGKGQFHVVVSGDGNVASVGRASSPGDLYGTCLFEAPTAEILQEVDEDAQFPFTRFVEPIALST